MRVPPWKEFLNEPEEWHAFVMGWGDGAGLRSAEALDAHPVIEAEPWYYKAGYGLGKLTWPLVLGLLIMFVWSVV